MVKSPDSKLIFTASGLHFGTMHFEDLEFRKYYGAFKSYNQSKLGVILTCRYLAKKLSHTSIGIYCQHPGMVNTDLGRNADIFSKLIFKALGISPEKGSKNLVFLAEAEKRDLVSGAYYVKQKPSNSSRQSYDLVMAEKLYKEIQKYLQDYLNEPSLLFSLLIKVK